MSRIADLVYGCVGGKIEVRILRRWTQRFHPNEIWFLAVDKYGDSIQILSSNTSHGFANAPFQLNRCYSITDYTCTELDRYQKILPNHVNINVGRVSKVHELPNVEEIPNFWFSFATMEHLQALIDKDTEFPDVIGYFRTCEKLLKKPDETFVKMELIHESGNVLPLTLWKECVTIPEKFAPSITTSIPVNAVVAVTNIKVATYSGGFSLNSTSATHVIIRPLCPTTSILEERLASGSIPDPLSAMETVSIAELKAMSYSALIGKTFLVKALLTFYDIGNSWYSVFCSVCKKPIPRRGDDWFCLNDGRDLKPNFRFYISATLDDDSSTVVVLLSDELVQKISGYTCEKLVAEDGFDDRKKLPPFFDAFLNKYYTFQIQQSRSSTTNKSFYTAINFTSSDIEQQPAVSLLPPDSAPVSETPGSSSSVTNDPHSPTPSTKTKRSLFPASDPDTTTNRPKRSRTIT